MKFWKLQFQKWKPKEVSSYSELEAITLNHFLERKYLCKKCWRQTQVVINQVLGRWLKEYLLALIKRKKWNLPLHNLNVGDLVLVVDEKTQRGD